MEEPDRLASVSPALGYKITDKLSIGATININYGLINLKRPVKLGQYDEKCSAFSVNFNMGLLYKPVPEFAVGLSLRTPTTINFSGDATMQYAALIGGANKSDLDREGKQPLWLGFGIAVKPMKKMTITADAQFTNWTELQNIPVSYTDKNWDNAANKAKYGYGDLDLKWENCWQLRFGLEYCINPTLAVRLGYYRDPAPSPLETLTILLPNVTYNVFTAGIGYRGGKIGVDLCMEYLKGKDRTVVYGQGLMPGVHGNDIVVPNLAITFYL